MRIAVAVVLTWGVAGGHAIAASTTSHCDEAIRIVLDANQNHPNGAGRCDVVAVDPDPAEACPGGWVTWTIDNRCKHEVRLKIGKRRPKYPKDANGEAFTTRDDLPSVPYPIPPGGTAEVKIQVDPSAKERAYKYDITGDSDIKTDPEIEVRRGPVPTPAPPPPSSSGNAPHP